MGIPNDIRADVRRLPHKPELVPGNFLYDWLHDQIQDNDTYRFLSLPDHVYIPGYDIISLQNVPEA